MSDRLSSWLNSGARTMDVSGDASRAVLDRLRFVAELVRSAPPWGGGAALLRRADDGKAVPAPVAGELTVGRSAPAGLVVPDPRLSRRHFRIALSGDVALVEDLDSRNGTWVNGERVKKRALRDGDVIEAGGQVFVFLGAPD